MIQYLVEDQDGESRKYGISYTELKELYYKFIAMDTPEFMSKLPEATHFACVIGWFKELGNEATISDCGIIHELVHLMVNGDQNEKHVQKVRKQFEFILKLD